MAWIFFLYLAVLLLIGVATRRAARGMSGFLLGDRRAGPWTTASRVWKPALTIT